MDHLISKLYAYLPVRAPRRSPEQEKAMEESRKICKLLAEQYGPEFVDRFLQLRDRIDGYDGEREFSRGFRLGARLMLELFQ